MINLTACYEGMGEVRAPRTEEERRRHAEFVKSDRRITREMLREAGLLKPRKRRNRRSR
ncbi:MAG: hypothetical protein V4474_03155 [Patescibacteria group bacterium]